MDVSNFFDALLYSTFSQMSVVKKRSLLWNLNSKHADVYPYPGETSRFRINLLDQINVGENERCYVTVRYAEIPNSYHQITAKKQNNAFIVDVNGLVAQIVVPDGTYYPFQLADVIQELMRSNATILGQIVNADSLTVTYDNSQNAFKKALDNTAAGDISVIFTNNGFGEFLGFRYEEVANAPRSYPILVDSMIRSTMAVDVIPDMTICLHCSLNINNAFSSKRRGRTNVLEYFTRGETGTRSVFGNTTTDVRNLITNRTISEIELWLTDDDDIPLVLNGLHWHVTLLFELEETN